MYSRFRPLCLVGESLRYPLDLTLGASQSPVWTTRRRRTPNLYLDSNSVPSTAHLEISRYTNRAIPVPYEQRLQREAEVQSFEVRSHEIQLNS
jgi:hypothetical protein